MCPHIPFLVTRAKTARALGAAGAGLVAKMAFNQLVLMAINPILGTHEHELWLLMEQFHAIDSVLVQ